MMWEGLHATDGFQTGGKGPKATECGQPLEVGKSKEKNSPRVSRKKYGPADTLTLYHWDQVRLQTYQTVREFCIVLSSS
jgi:hypothetical protein